MKLEFDVLYGRSSAETKRQLDDVVRDDVALLDEHPKVFSVCQREATNRYQRRVAIIRRLARARGAS